MTTKPEPEYPNLAQLYRQLRAACCDPAMKGVPEMAIEMPWADWMVVKAELNKVLRGTK